MMTSRSSPPCGAGARGYVLKGAIQEEIVRAIHAVAAGEAIFGPGIARMLGRLSGKAVATDPFPQLTPRERQVLELLAAGLSTTVIGTKLGLASKTINNHASAVCAKLQVADRTEAVLRAREAGWAAARAALTSEPKRWLSNASRAFSRSPILSASRAGSHGHQSLSAIMLGRWASGRIH